MAEEGKKDFRPDLYVVARFLERLSLSGKEYKRTQLQMAVGLNYNVYVKYLNWLIEKGLITIEKGSDGHDYVRITEKGLDSHARLVEWMKEIMGTRAI
jgi:predicted transcriptional regulator